MKTIRIQKKAVTVKAKTGYSPAEKRDFALQLCVNATPAELAMKEALRKVRGVKFGFQKIVCGYIPDFWCAELKLIIEVDGSIHEQRKEYDAYRDGVFSAKGITVLRFSNADVLDNPAACIARIRSLIDYPTLHKQRRRKALRQGKDHDKKFRVAK